jgi:DNA-directed RNA polymerase subunit RPC12/RpoP
MEQTLTAYKKTTCKHCGAKVILIKNHKGHLKVVEFDSVEETDTEFNETKHIKHKVKCEGGK